VLRVYAEKSRPVGASLVASRRLLGSPALRVPVRFRSPGTYTIVLIAAPKVVGQFSPFTKTFGVNVRQ
jgi:hypothetical protein